MKLTIVLAVLALGIVVVGSPCTAAPTVTIEDPLDNSTLDFDVEFDVNVCIVWSTAPEPDPCLCYSITVDIELVCPRTLEQLSSDNFSDCVDGGASEWAVSGVLTTQADEDPNDPNPGGGFCIIANVDGGSDEITLFVEAEECGGGNSFERYDGPAFGVSFLGRVSLSLGGF